MHAGVDTRQRECNAAPVTCIEKLCTLVYTILSDILHSGN